MAEGSSKGIYMTALIGALATVAAAVVQVVLPGVLPTLWTSAPKAAMLALAFADPAEAAPATNLKVSVDCGAGTVQAVDAVGPQYRYQVSAGASPVDCVIRAQDERHQPVQTILRVVPGETLDKTIPLTRVSQPAVTGKRTARSPELAQLALECDTVEAQFKAARSAMAERIKDLGGQPVKPELQAAMDGGSSHLLAARQAIHSGQANVASQRLEQVKRSIQILNSI